MTYGPPPVPPRGLFRGTRFGGTSAGGEAASTFRFRDVFNIAGVFVAVPDDTAGDDAGPGTFDGACCCGGMVFSCFCGELVAEEDTLS